MWNWRSSFIFKMEICWKKGATCLRLKMKRMFRGRWISQRLCNRNHTYLYNRNEDILFMRIVNQGNETRASSWLPASYILVKQRYPVVVRLNWRQGLEAATSENESFLSRNLYLPVNSDTSTKMVLKNRYAGQ